jgi:BTB/POZ domain
VQPTAMSSEKFCLKWNDFERNISSAFRDIRDEKEFFDITLACEDEQLSAHRVILSACSPFFKSVLRRNPHQHPLLYLKGVSFRDMQVCGGTGRPVVKHL